VTIRSKSIAFEVKLCIANAVCNYVFMCLLVVLFLLIVIVVVV